MTRTVALTVSLPQKGPSLTAPDVLFQAVFLFASQDVFVPDNEDPILETAGIILDAVILSQAVADGRLDESRFRARLIAIESQAAGWQEVARAAQRVTYDLGVGSTLSLVRDTLAMDELFFAIERSQRLFGRRDGTRPEA